MNRGAKRCCWTCLHFIPVSAMREEAKYHDIPDGDDLTGIEGVCEEGGFSEIGNANRELTEEECNAWTEK